MVLYENKYNNAEYIEYEASLFEFVFHRVASYYQLRSEDNDIAGNTEAWWLPAKDFVKLDLGDADNALIKCLKIYQDLLAYNLETNNEDVLIFNDFRTSSEQPIHYINPINKKSILLEASMLIFIPKGLGADARGARDGTPSAVRVRFLSESPVRVRRREIL